MRHPAGLSGPRSPRARVRRSAIAVVVVLVTALVAGGCKFDGAYDLPLPGNKVSADDAYPVTADFADALNVVPRTAVMIDDVVVGQVSEVERKGWHARVKFLIRKDIELPENVEVDVRQTSLLGEKYIALVRPSADSASADMLKAGAFIPLSRTGRNPEVEEVLGALSMVLSGGGIGQLKTISVELNKMLNGRTDQARSLLGNVERLVGALDGQKGDIIAAMESIDKLSVTLVKEKETIGDAIDAMGPALKVLNRQQAGLMKMLRQLDSLEEVSTRVLDASTDNIVASLRHLQPTLTKLAEAGDSLPRGLSMIASFPFPEQAENIVRGDYANALFQLDIDLNDILESPGEFLPQPVDLCLGATQGNVEELCKGLDAGLKKLVCGLVGKNGPVAAYLCDGEGDLGLETLTKPKKDPLSGLLGGDGNGRGSTDQPGEGGGSGGLSGLLGGGGAG